jgi:hypothetical protein
MFRTQHGTLQYIFSPTIIQRVPVTAFQQRVEVDVVKSVNYHSDHFRFQMSLHFPMKCTLGTHMRKCSRLTFFFFY